MLTSIGLGLPVCQKISRTSDKYSAAMSQLAQSILAQAQSLAEGSIRAFAVPMIYYNENKLFYIDTVRGVI